MDSNIAFLFKSNLLATVAMKAGRNGGEVLAAVPPFPPKILRYNNVFETIEGFEDVIDLCLDDDWKLIHKGAPNYG